jgi:hypothetical protein
MCFGFLLYLTAEAESVIVQGVPVLTVLHFKSQTIAEVHISTILIIIDMFVLGDLMKIVQKAAAHHHIRRVVMQMIQSCAHALRNCSAIISCCRSQFSLSKTRETLEIL